MATIESIIVDYSPANDDIGVPLLSTVEILFSTEMDEDVLEREFFISGPDTDQFVGPGVATFNLFPNNVSEGDEFLESPGYKGIVQGTFSFERISPTDPDVEVEESPYRTKLIFTPDNPLAALTLYTAHLPEATDLEENEYTGHVTFSFTTGTGSITELPSTTSTSILTTLNQSASLSSLTALRVVKTTPSDHAINQPTTLEQIIIEFNKVIEESSIDDDAVLVKGIAATDHPTAAVTVNENITKVITVSGKKIIITI